MSLIQLREPPPPPEAASDASWQTRLERLQAWLSRYRRVVVAYSGGVDSSVVLRVARQVMGEGAIGVIGRSDSYAERELSLALDQAAGFGARVEIVTTGELADPAFRSNGLDRCYHCKSELYRELGLVAARERAEAVLDGTIADDLSDWRPGRRAAAEREVQSPLAELGFTKAEVRAVAACFGLSSQEKPASPCLASRIPYGTEITKEMLEMIEGAEDLVRSLGLAELRVRHHGDVARIEIPLAELARALEPVTRDRLVQGLKALGFRHITIDLEGLRSGSLNPPEVAGGAYSLGPKSAVKDS